MFVFVLLFVGVVFGQEWRYGRGTFYGNEPWYWSIHYGSCGYGYICPEEGTGWDVAAMSDLHLEYSGSCGRCYEVKCNPTFFRDGYGQTLDRTNVCHDIDASVLMTIVDTCPCNYATNAYSNRRWCCGDMDHFDMSVWSFEKLAEIKWGVIGLMYRPVPCNFKAFKAAPPPAEPHWGESPEAYGQSCPKHNFPVYSDEPEPPAVLPQSNSVVTAFAGPAQYNQLVEDAPVIPQSQLTTSDVTSDAATSANILLERANEDANTLPEQSAAAAASAASISTETLSKENGNILADALSYAQSKVEVEAEPVSVQQEEDTSQIDLGSLKQEVKGSDGRLQVVEESPLTDAEHTVVYGGDGKGSFELSNWNAEVWEMPHVGLHGQAGICGKVYSGGAISLKGAPGSFDGHMMVEFWTRTEGGLANAAINIQGGNRGCAPLMFKQLEAAEVDGAFTRYEVLLEQFVDGEHSAENLLQGNQYNPFQGCNGMTVAQIERVSFHNYENHEQFFCIDEVALHSDIANND